LGWKPVGIYKDPKGEEWCVTIDDFKEERPISVDVACYVNKISGIVRSQDKEKIIPKEKYADYKSFLEELAKKLNQHIVLVSETESFPHEVPIL